MRTSSTLRGVLSAAILTVALGAGVATAPSASAAVPAAPHGRQALRVIPVDNGWWWPQDDRRGDGPRFHDNGRGGHWDNGRRAHGDGDDGGDDRRDRLRQARERCENRRPLTPWGEWDWDDGDCRWRD